MSSELSNSLADLAERVREAQAESRDAERTAAERAIEAGRLLCRAKEECRHGEWLPFLKRAEMPERQAQRMMQLARSGLKSDTVTDLGGVKAALGYLAQLGLPGTGEVMLIGERGWRDLPEDERRPLAMVFPHKEHQGFFDVTVIDFGRPIPTDVDPALDKSFLTSSAKPVRAESICLDDGRWVSGLWETVDLLLRVPHADREFTYITDKIDADVMAQLAISPRQTNHRTSPA